jgi:hypothetical protein
MKNFEIVNLTNDNIVLNINDYDYTIKLNVIGDLHLGLGHAPDVYQIIASKNGSTKELDLCYLSCDDISIDENIDEFTDQLETIKFPKHFDDFDNYTAKFKWCPDGGGAFSEGRVKISGSDPCTIDFFYRQNGKMCCITTNSDGTKSEFEKLYILTLFTLNEIVNDHEFTKK